MPVQHLRPTRSNDTNEKNPGLHGGEGTKEMISTWQGNITLAACKSESVGRMAQTEKRNRVSVKAWWFIA